MQSYPFTSLVTYDEYGNPIYDRAVDSEFLRKFYRKDRSNGVVALDNSNSFLVSSYSGMTIKVNAGMCFINGAYAIEDDERELIVEASDVNQDRIDSVVLRLNDNTNVRSIDLYIVKGIPATIPTPPTLTREGGVYELGIADIFIPKNSSAITNERITDTRLNTERCGYSLPLQEIDTSGLYQQLQDQIEKNIELIQSAIDETTASLLSNRIDDVAEDVNQNTADINQNTADIVTLNTNLENNYTKCLIKKARIQYNGTIGSNHLIDISSKLPVDKPCVVIPIQWGYEMEDSGYKLFGNSFANGYLCDCSYNNSLKQFCLIPRDSKRIETFSNLFVYYWIILS